MNINDYTNQATHDSREELAIFLERNNVYATDDNIFDNTERMAVIAQALGINITAEEVEWLYLIGKLVRERRVHKDDNFTDAVNFLRRIKAIK